MEEGEKMAQCFLDTKGQAMDPYEPILLSCLYVVCGMLFGFDSKLVNNREALKAIGTVDETRHVRKT